MLSSLALSTLTPARNAIAFGADRRDDNRRRQARSFLLGPMTPPAGQKPIPIVDRARLFATDKKTRQMGVREHLRWFQFMAADPRVNTGLPIPQATVEGAMPLPFSFRPIALAISDKPSALLTPGKKVKGPEQRRMLNRQDLFRRFNDDVFDILQSPGELQLRLLSLPGLKPERVAQTALFVPDAGTRSDNMASLFGRPTAASYILSPSADSPFAQPITSPSVLGDNQGEKFLFAFRGAIKPEAIAAAYYSPSHIVTHVNDAEKLLADDGVSDAKKPA